MRELDVLLLRFLDGHYAVASPAEQAAFGHLLELPDPEILALLMGRGEAQDPSIHAVIGRIRSEPGAPPR
jgi:antitoxin CptB